MSDSKLLKVECDDITDLLPTPDEVATLNCMVTDPKALIDEEEVKERIIEAKELDVNKEEIEIEKTGLGLQGIPDESLPEMEIAREEDYHRVRESSQLEILLEYIIPRECKENNDGVHLTAFFMTKLAQSQIFGEGNKRTAYLVGTLFLRHLQNYHSFEEAIIPDLNKELTKLLSDIAISEEVDLENKEIGEDRDVTRGLEDLERYLREGMSQFLRD